MSNLTEHGRFFGYIIENGSITPTNDKTKAVENFPVATDQKAT